MKLNDKAENTHRRGKAHLKSSFLIKIEKA